MRARWMTLTAGAVMTALAATLVVAGAGDAGAYTGSGTGGAPSWVPGDAARKGQVLIYDAAGNQIFGGYDVNNIAVGSYLAASGGAVGLGANKVTAKIAVPDPTNANVDTWATGNILPINYTFSPVPASTPASVSANLAFMKINALGVGWLDVASAGTLYAGSNTDYKNVLELRIQDNADASNYWATDIEFNPPTASSSYDGLAAGEWKVVWPAPPVVSNIATTATAPTPSVSSPKPAGTSVSFSTDVAPVSGTVPGGTVKFFDGSNQIGATKNLPGAVSAGTPTTITSDATTSLTVGSHNITAQFTPSGSGFNGVTSAISTFVVESGPAAATSTALVSNPATTADTSTDVVLTATVANVAVPATIPTGSVGFFKDGAGTAMGTATVNASGVAVYTIPKSTLTLGSHSFTASFTLGAGFEASTSSAVMVDITLALPANVVAPIAGPATVGLASSCNPGAWTYAGGFTYAWSHRASSTAAWASFSTDRVTGLLPATFAGHQVKCTVQAFNPVGSAAAPVDSAVVVVGLGAAPRNTVRPKIVGTPKVGIALKASVGTWSLAPTRYLYVWKAGTVIVSRTSAYRPKAAYRGKYLTVTVYAVKVGYKTGTAASLRVLIR